MMKAKHFWWIISAVVAAVAAAVGVVVLVNKFFGDRIAQSQYIECGDDEVVE